MARLTWSACGNNQTACVKLVPRRFLGSSCATSVFTFKVVTKDGTARHGEDYEQLSQIMTMRGDEMERDIIVRIYQDDQVELDEEFHVCLLDEYYGTQLPGKNTIATVTIIDDDTPGYIGFEGVEVKATPEQGFLKVTLRRDGGASGDATVNVTTTFRSKLLEGY